MPATIPIYFKIFFLLLRNEIIDVVNNPVIKKGMSKPNAYTSIYKPPTLLDAASSIALDNIGPIHGDITSDNKKPNKNALIKFMLEISMLISFCLIFTDIVIIPVSCKPNIIMMIPLIKVIIVEYSSIKGFIVSMAKASIRNITLSPKTKNNEFRNTTIFLLFLFVAK